MSEEITDGTFDYLKWFPQGNKAYDFRPIDSIAVTASKPLTVRKFYEEWIEKKKPPFVRVSLERNYRQDFHRNILPFMGDMELNRVSVDTLESFRDSLGERAAISSKDCAEYHRRFTSGDDPRLRTTNRAQPVQRSSAKLVA